MPIAGDLYLVDVAKPEAARKVNVEVTRQLTELAVDLPLFFLLH